MGGVSSVLNNLVDDDDDDDEHNEECQPGKEEYQALLKTEEV